MDYQQYLCSREWGLRREAIAARSNGRCERCLSHFAASVHHLTYERKFNEPLDDLIHLCKGCHEYIHGRSDRDPAELRVYMAGPVVESAVESPEDCCDQLVRWRDEIWGVTKHGDRFCPGLKMGRFLYWGPLISGSHGLAYDGHALGFSTHDGSGRERELVNRCLAQVRECSLLFAWIDRKETVGTLCEITVASMMGKPVFIAFANDELYRHFYFCAHVGDNYGDEMVFDSARSAWSKFLDWLPSFMGFKQRSHFLV